MLTKLLRHYRNNEFVYPGVLIRKLDISVEQAYLVLECLKDNGILEVNYEFYCHDCGKFVNRVYRTYSEIPIKIIADCCGLELDVMDHSIVIYRVVKDGLN